MKKMLSLLVAVALVACAAQAASVESANVAGVVNIAVPAAEWILISSALDGFGAQSGRTLEDIFGADQLAQHDFAPQLCDRVVVWDVGTQAYTTWAQKTDGLFYLATAAGFGAHGTDADRTVMTGEAMWIIPNGAKTVTVTGEAVDQAQVTTSFNATQWDMVGYPFSAATTLGETAFADNAAKNDNSPGVCDRIIVWEGGAYNTYAAKTDGSWFRANTGSEFFLGSVPADDKVIDIGQGFWVNPYSTFDWVELTPYTL